MKVSPCFYLPTIYDAVDDHDYRCHVVLMQCSRCGWLGRFYPVKYYLETYVMLNGFAKMRSGPVVVMPVPKYVTRLFNDGPRKPNKKVILEHCYDAFKTYVAAWVAIEFSILD